MKRIINSINRIILTKLLGKCTHKITVYNHDNGYYTICCSVCKAKLDTREYNEVCKGKITYTFHYILFFIVGVIVGIIIRLLYYNN
jgi:hypothetical protein